MSITIYHYTGCSSSRNILSLIRASGEEPIVIDYLSHPPSKSMLASMIAAAGLSVRGAIRSNEPEYARLQLHNPSLSDDTLLDAMVAHPILINRPFIVTPKGVRLCRPLELALEVLPNPDVGDFLKEDGAPLISCD